MNSKMSTSSIEIDMLILSCLIDKDYYNFVELLTCLPLDDIKTYGNILKDILIDNVHDVNKDDIIMEFATHIIDKTYLQKLIAAISATKHTDALLSFVFGSVKSSNTLNRFSYGDYVTFLTVLLDEKLENTPIVGAIFDIVCERLNVGEIVNIFNLFVDTHMTTLYTNVSRVTKIQSTAYKMKLTDVLIRFMLPIEDKIKLTTSTIYTEFNDETTLNIHDIYHRFYAMTIDYIMTNSSLAIINFHNLRHIVVLDTLPVFGNGQNDDLREKFVISKKYVQDTNFMTKLFDLVKMVFRCSDNIHSNHNVERSLNIIRHMFLVIYRETSRPSVSFLNGVQDLYDILTLVINGMNGKINNPHIRTSAISLLCDISIARKDGLYSYYLGENVVYALINYLKDVKYSDWMNINEDINHSHIIMKLLDACMTFLKCEKINVSNIISPIDDNTIVFVLLQKLGNTLDNVIELIESEDIPIFVKLAQLSMFIDVVNRIVTLLLQYFVSNKILTSDITLMINITCFKLDKFFDTIKARTPLVGEINNIVKKIKCNMLRIFTNLIDNGIMNVASVDKGVLNKLVAEIKFESTEKILNFLKSPEYVKYEINSENIFDLPDDLVDPIFSVPVRNPIMLPHNRDIYDMDYMFVNIRTSGQNPQTREKISVSDVISYNNTEDIISTIKEYKTKHSEYFSHSKL
jgi:hypothetical protein